VGGHGPLGQAQLVARLQLGDARLSSPVLAWRLLLKVLISVDLPTLGTPQISTRMGLAMPPRLGDSRWQASISLRVGAGSEASGGKARVSLWALYQSTHSYRWFSIRTTEADANECYEGV